MRYLLPFLPFLIEAAQLRENSPIVLDIKKCRNLDITRILKSGLFLDWIISQHTINPLYRPIETIATCS